MRVSLKWNTKTIRLSPKLLLQDQVYDVYDDQNGTDGNARNDQITIELKQYWLLKLLLFFQSGVGLFQFWKFDSSNLVLASFNWKFDSSAGFWVTYSQTIPYGNHLDHYVSANLGNLRISNMLYSGWWFEPSWKIWKSMGRIIPYMMETYGK